MKMKKVTAFLFALALIFILPVSAGAASISLSVPEAPTVEAQFYAADYAEVLSAETEAAILSANQTLRTELGAEIVVVTVDFTDGQSVEEYAYELGNKWGIGSAEYNNGVLLVLSIGDDDYYCAVGDGLNDLSGKVKTVLDSDLEPDFAAKNYDAGVLKCFNSLVTMVKESGVGGQLSYYNETEDYTFSGYRQSASGGMSGAVIGLSLIVSVVPFFVLIILFIALLTRSAGRRNYRYGSFPLWPLLFMGRRRPPFFGGHHHHHHRNDHHNHFGGFGGFGGGGSFGGGGGFGGGFGGGGAGRG